MIKNIKYFWNYLFTKNLPINMYNVGVNSFFNSNIFGLSGDAEIKAQFLDITQNLKMVNCRLLFNWNDQVQKSSNAPKFFGFYDSIVSAGYDNVKLIPVINGCPSWNNSSDKTKNLSMFLDKWVFPIIERYGSSEKIYGFQIGNEINTSLFPAIS